MAIGNTSLMLLSINYWYLVLVALIHSHTNHPMLTDLTVVNLFLMTSFDPSPTPACICTIV